MYEKASHKFQYSYERRVFQASPGKNVEFVYLFTRRYKDAKKRCQFARYEFPMFL